MPVTTTTTTTAAAVTAAAAATAATATARNVSRHLTSSPPPSSTPPPQKGIGWWREEERNFPSQGRIKSLAAPTLFLRGRRRAGVTALLMQSVPIFTPPPPPPPPPHVLPGVPQPNRPREQQSPNSFCLFTRVYHNFFFFFNCIEPPGRANKNPTSPQNKRSQISW